MPITVYQSKYYTLDVEDSESAIALAQRVIDGTASEEDLALVLASGDTGIEGELTTL